MAAQNLFGRTDARAAYPRRHQLDGNKTHGIRQLQGSLQRQPQERTLTRNLQDGLAALPPLHQPALLLNLPPLSVALHPEEAAVLQHPQPSALDNSHLKVCPTSPYVHVWLPRDNSAMYNLWRCMHLWGSILSWGSREPTQRVIHACLSSFFKAGAWGSYVSHQISATCTCSLARVEKSSWLHVEVVKQESTCQLSN